MLAVRGLVVVRGMGEVMPMTENTMRKVARAMLDDIAVCPDAAVDTAADYLADARADGYKAGMEKIEEIVVGWRGTQSECAEAIREEIIRAETLKE